MKAEAPASRLSESIAGQNRIPTNLISLEYARVLIEELVFLLSKCLTFMFSQITWR